MTLLHDIARTSSAVAETSSRLGKVRLLSECLRRLRPDEVPVGVAYLSGTLPQGTIGVGWASLRDLPGPAGSPTLELLEIDGILERIASTTGPGSVAARRELLAGLFARATEEERRFLFGLLLGELRQGALEGLMVEAVANAADVPASELRRALMLAGDLGTVARAAVAEGREGLARFLLVPLHPVKPMLAQTAEDVDDALARISPASVEWKLDGARIHAHRLGQEVRVFTRNLADSTHRVPEIVEAMSALEVESVVLDGEAIALRGEIRPQPFGVTMSRFGSHLEVDRLRGTTPLTAFFFDCLHLNGEDLTGKPAGERLAVLDSVVPQAFRIPRLVTGEVEVARDFLDQALAHGHEGVMVKALDAPYQAGRRGASWLKVKRAHTLDLVVLAAEWGHGRRRGWLSNLHLGARDPATGGFVMLGKTFKGMTDEMLRWQTERFQEIEDHRDDFAVFVRPEVVVEVAFDGLLPSPRYPGGLALRFARVKGYRPDKGPEEADTIDTVRAIHAGQRPEP